MEDISSVERLHKAVTEECTKLGFNFKDEVHIVKDAQGSPVLDKDGKPVTQRVTVLSSLTDEAKELFEVLNFNTPCWFKGCDKLREQYKEEKENTGCQTCIGALTRKYMSLAKIMIQADPDRIKPKSLQRHS